MAKVRTPPDADRARKHLALLCAGLAATWIVLTICLWNDAFFEGKELSDPSLLVRLFLGFHPPRVYMPLRLVTYSLMHTPRTLIADLILLVVVYRWGREVLEPEDFVRVYSLSTVVGGLAYLLISRLVGSFAPYIGALPALMGAIGLLAVLNPERKADEDTRAASGCFWLLALPLCFLSGVAPFRGCHSGAAFGAACVGLSVGMAYGFLQGWWRERSAAPGGAFSGVGGLIILLAVLAGLGAASLALYKEHEQLAQVIDTVRSGTERERHQAAAELARTEEWSEQVVQGLIVGLDDPSEEIRRLVADALLELVRRRPAMHAYDGLDDFVALLEHKRSDVRILGMRCLVSIAGKVSTYHRAIKNEDVRVRRSAARGLALMAVGGGDESAVATLIEHWRDEDAVVRNTAIKGAVQSFLDVTGGRSSQSAAKSLRQLGPGHDAAIPFLEEAEAHSRYSEIRTAARRALVRITGIYTGWPFDAAEAKRRQKETAAALGVPVDKTVDLGGRRPGGASGPQGGVKMDLVLIPPGEFMMGSPRTEHNRDSDETQHRVRITKPFYMSRTEVTQEQWQAVMGSNPGHFKGAKNPVDSVSWNECQTFVEKLSAKVEGLTFALPTEAEWEYACRAGASTPFHTGETISTDEANYDGNYTYGNGRKGEYRRKTISVGSFRPNASGLYDMHGNVWEWCQDWYAEGYYKNSPRDDPTGAAKGDCRVLRGGSWLSFPRHCRSTDRSGYIQSGRASYGGCRVVVRDVR